MQPHSRASYSSYECIRKHRKHDKRTANIKHHKLTFNVSSVSICCRLSGSLFFMHTVIGAPNIGVARRISATSIEMNWDPLSEAASYSVRYRLVERVARRNLDDTYTTVETTNTNIIITDLDPRLGYAVSVAARTSVGVGNYSEEITVGCKLTPILVNVTCYTCLL